MEAKLKLVLGLAATLACSACGRRTEMATADPKATCASPAVAAQIKTGLLDTGRGQSRRYAQRAEGASIVLDDVELTGYDAQTREAACTATAHLISPVLADTFEARQHLTYAVRPRDDGGIQVADLQVPQDEDRGKFAELLGRRDASTAVATPTPSPPTIIPVKAAAPTAAPAAPTSVPDISEEDQQLVDQAGDTRAAGNALEGADASPAPDAERPNDG